MDKLKNYNDYADYIRSQVNLGKRPRTNSRIYIK